MATKKKSGGRKGGSGIQSITTCLAFKDRAEEAVKFYVSAFPRSKIVSLSRSKGDGPIPKGKLMGATFVLFGREFTAFDGGPPFSFSIGMSPDRRPAELVAPDRRSGQSVASGRRPGRVDRVLGRETPACRDLGGGSRGPGCGHRCRYRRDCRRR